MTSREETVWNVLFLFSVAMGKNFWKTQIKGSGMLKICAKYDLRMEECSKCDTFCSKIKKNLVPMNSFSFQVNNAGDGQSFHEPSVMFSEKGAPPLNKSQSVSSIPFKSDPYTPPAWVSAPFIIIIIISYSWLLFSRRHCFFSRLWFCPSFSSTNT